MARSLKMSTTFDTWWDSLTYIPNDRKILSKLAWDAAISCSNCGGDVRQHCRYCGVKKNLKNAMYLKGNGWSFKTEDNRKGWVDPRTCVHYFVKEAVQIQLIRDSSKTARFRKEPGYYD